MSAANLESDLQDSPPLSGAPDLQTVIDIVLRQEQHRKESERRQRQEEMRQSRLKQQLSDEKLHEAVQVIKWCVVGICGAVILAVVLGIWALVQVERAVSEVEREVESVTKRVDDILHEIEHPFEGAGKLLGRDLDKSIAEYLGLAGSSSADK